MAQQRKSFLHGFLFFLNILAALALLLSYLAYYVDPSTFSYLAFFGLGYPLILLLNLFFILYWILRLRSKVLLSIVCIAIGYLHLMRFYQASGSHKAVNPGETLKVMTYNVRLFNKYGWLPPDTESRIAELIAEQDPDILFLQEYFFRDQAPDFNYPHRYQIFKLQNQGSGLVIFSKYPLLETGSIRYGIGPDGTDGGRAIYADIEFDRQRIRLMNTHLASVGFQEEEYNRLENPNAGRPEEIKNDFLRIARQINHAFVKRSHQAKVLAQAIANSPYPVICAGDFNDTPHSFAYHLINQPLTDSYLEAGSGFSRTYAKSPIPLRIDHIFCDPKFSVFNYQVLAKEYSDHFPVTATFEWQ
mgnify:CR=1 FL=1